MSTKAAPIAVGAIRSRSLIDKQSAPHARLVTNRLLTTVPHSQSSSLSQETNEKSGMCSVCLPFVKCM